MATIDLGKIKLVWRGAYNNSTAYTVDDVVQHTDGGVTSSFICTTNSTGNAPSTGGSVHGSWAYLAKGHADTVSTTLSTQGDLLYRDGSGLQRLAKPASNKYLQNTSGGVLSWEAVSSAIRKISMFNDATYNITTSSASVSFPITFDFVKAQADSDLFVFGWTPVSEQNSHLAGMRMRIQKTSDSSYDSGNDNEQYGGQLYAGMMDGASVDDQKGRVDWSRRIDTSSETFFNSAETYRIHLGWSSRDGSSQRPGSTWNPQHKSSRHRQTTTNVWVWELDPSTTAFVT